MGRLPRQQPRRRHFRTDRQLSWSVPVAGTAASGQDIGAAGQGFIWARQRRFEVSLTRQHPAGMKCRTGAQRSCDKAGRSRSRGLTWSANEWPRQAHPQPRVRPGASRPRPGGTGPQRRYPRESRPSRTRATGKAATAASIEARALRSVSAITAHTASRAAAAARPRSRGSLASAPTASAAACVATQVGHRLRAGP